MISTKHAHFMTAVAILCCAGSISCTQTKLPPEISNRLQGVKTEMLAAKSLLRTTNASLKDLRDSDNKNVRARYDAYATSLTNLQAKAAGAGWVADMARDKSDEHFKYWEEMISTIENADTRAKGSERRTEALQEYNELRAMGAELRASYRPYAEQLTDIKSSLAADVTVQGVQKGRPAINKALDGESAIIKQVDAAARKIDSITNG